MNAPDAPIAFHPDDDPLDDQRPLVLVVDDEPRSQEAMRRTLEDDFRVLTAGDTAAARALLARHPVAVILCDQRMPGQSGVDFLKTVRAEWPDVVRLVISGYADSEDIIAGVNEAGIYQYVLKPWVPQHLLETVRGAIEARHLHGDLQRLDLELRAGAPALRARLGERLREARSRFGFERIVRAPGSPLDGVCALAERVARHDLSVLLLGESGTGKELMARAIHYASARHAAAFVVENCAAIPDTLLESELFGHKRGAFTGAYEDHVGLFQRAHGGTVFLDEIGETSPAFQVRLLRVLQEGELRPVGSTRSIPVNVRVIAATHRRLAEEVRAGRFREDLYYRLAGVSLEMPPLRERAGDIGAIARHLLAEVGREMGLDGAELGADTLACLAAYAWPGNIRELRNEIARALALGDGRRLQARDFSTAVRLGGAAARAPRAAATAPAAGSVGSVGPTGSAELAAAHAPPTVGTLQQRLDAIEAMMLREALHRLRWNRTHVAAELGLSRVGLRAKLRRFGLDGEGGA